MATQVQIDLKSICAYPDTFDPYAAFVSPMESGWQPADPLNFGIHVQVFAGASGDDRSDSFDLTVCTPAWIASELGNTSAIDYRPHLWGAGLLIVKTWSPSTVRDAIEQAMGDVDAGPDWGSVADRLGRVIPWEFAYKYDRHINRLPGPAFP